MKTIKQFVAVLSCIAAAGSLTATGAFAAETGTTELTVDAKAVACGYTTSQSNDLYDSEKDRIRLGGSLKTGLLPDYLNEKYEIAGGDRIIYNQKDVENSKDSCVSYLRFELPADVAETDTYTLSMTTDGLGHYSRTGHMEIYAGIADMNTTVITDNTALGDSWTTINWTTKPTISNVKLVASDVNTASGTNVSMTLSEVLKGQKKGPVTIALLSKPTNTQEMADSWFKDVKITRTSPVQAKPEYTDANKILPETADGEAKDAVGFIYSFTSGESIEALTWKVSCEGYEDKIVEGTIADVSGGVECIVGLLITDLPEGVTADSISAQAAVQ